MENHRHTPGPWYPENTGSEVEDLRYEVRTEDGHQEGLLVASVLPQPERTRHNAYLLAAAPELLDACDVSWDLCAALLARVRHNNPLTMDEFETLIRPFWRQIASARHKARYGQSIALTPVADVSEIEDPRM